MSNKNDGRWWEFYGIRYAQGSIIGAIIIYFLFSKNESLKSLLFIPTDPNNLGIPHLILLWSYGMVYCYIASAPILVIHAGRGLLFKSNTNPNPYKYSWVSILIILLSTSICAGLAYWRTPEKYAQDYFLIGALLSLIITTQMILLANIFFFRWESTIQYIVSVIDKRKQESNFEYVETYRHMREHGNAFFIVFFQIALASAIFLLLKDNKLSHNETINALSLIFLAWITPAMIIWLFANKMENHLKQL